MTNYLSHGLWVRTVRNGEFEEVNFDEGVFASRKIGKSSQPTGTIVEWNPSEEFFDHVEVEVPKVKSLFKTIVCLCPGLTIELDDNGNKETFYSKNGLNDLADEYVKDTELIDNRLIVNFEEGKYKLDLILTYTSNYSSRFVSYVNAGLVETSPILTQIKTTLTREMNKFFREKKWLKEKEENLTGDDLQEGMFMVFNATCPSVAYDSQVKTRVVSMDCKSEVAGFTSDLVDWLNRNEKEVKIIADKALNARKAREAAKKAREKAREMNSKPKNKLLNLPSKLVDANAKDRSKCELFIVEGDSAAGGLIEARDPETQAIFPIRGKMINALKSADDKVLANQEVNNLIKALGLEFDAKTKKLVYDKNKLRYGKIFTATDADPDGASIKNLIFTNLWNLCPELFINGHIWITIPPLFRITKGKDTYIYLKDSKALEEYKDKHKGEKYLVNRNKGLGEQDAEELGPCILEPESRNVAQITIENVKKTEILLDILLGTSVPPRRAWLLEHAEEASDNLW